MIFSCYLPKMGYLPQLKMTWMLSIKDEIVASVIADVASCYLLKMGSLPGPQMA